MKVTIAQKGPTAPQFAWYEDYIGETFEVLEESTDPWGRPAFIVNGRPFNISGILYVQQEDCEVAGE